jgi:lipopolysaccharide transport system permease protein
MVSSSFATKADIGPLAPFRTIWSHRKLIARLASRELSARYRGSILGAAWMAANPLLMLAVYSFVFMVVFNARWGAGSSSVDFALYLFSGMILFGVFSEVISRAPMLMMENVSYIKKVVFPLEILPVVALASALASAAVGFVILFLFQLVVSGVPPVTALATPLILAPLCLLTLGLGWFLSSLGVFLRDVRQLVGVAVTVLMFLSPIFYPVEAVPAEFRPFLNLNPLAPILEQSKDVLFRGRLPAPVEYLAVLAVSAVVCWAGYAWFVKTRRGFADVV